MNAIVHSPEIAASMSWSQVGKALLHHTGHADFDPIAALKEMVPFRLVRKQTLDELRRLAMHDNLTNLLNRNGFDLEFLELVRRAQKNGNDVTFVLLDVDYFKQVNDGPGGHAEGDDVLKRVARIVANAIRKSKRGYDLAVRIGGEEILVIIEDKQIMGEAVAVRICRTVEAQLSNELGKITMSAGVARIDSAGITAEQLLQGSPQDIPAVKEALAAADRRLYFAKHGGRNCVCSSDLYQEGIVYSGPPRSPIASRLG